jgi:hypothetical protein
MADASIPGVGFWKVIGWTGTMGCNDAEWAGGSLFYGGDK